MLLTDVGARRILDTPLVDPRSSQFPFRICALFAFPGGGRRWLSARTRRHHTRRYRRDYRVTVVRRRRVVRSRARVKWQHISIMGVEAAGATSTEHPRVSFPRQINTVQLMGPTRTRRAGARAAELTDGRSSRSKRYPARAGTRRTGGNCGGEGDRKVYTEVLNVKVPSSRPTPEP